MINQLVAAGAVCDVKCVEGETPLHRASRMGHIASLKALLQNGASPKIRNACFNTALDVAGDFDSRIKRKDRSAVRQEILMHAPSMRTLILHHSDCLEHIAGDGQHQEAPARVIKIMGKLQNAKTFASFELDISDSFELASDVAIARAHSREYIDFLESLNQQVSASNKPVPFTPQVQKAISLTPAEDIKDADKSDTIFSPGSLRAAKRAAGSVIHAIDSVLSGTHRNAFCVVRPPGHHAGVNGLEADAVSCGFCIFNNVAIGAMHALHSSASAAAAVVRRVAIIDFDVHHGNGTQGIVEELGDSKSTICASVFVKTDLGSR
eukprot:SAG11_NODE_4476_length_1881_cov_1.396745_1_plen_322_part_00